MLTEGYVNALGFNYETQRRCRKSCRSSCRPVLNPVYSHTTSSLDSSVMQARYLAFDLETSTGNVNTAFPLKVAAAALDENLEEIDYMNIWVKPNLGGNGEDQPLLVEPEAMQVNRIDLVKHYKAAIPLWKARIQFREFIIKHTTHTYQLYEVGKSKIVCSEPLIPVGQFYSYDREVIIKHIDQDFGTTVSRRGLDTGIIGQFLKTAGKLPENAGLSLRKQAERVLNDVGNSGRSKEWKKNLRLNLDNAHDALADVRLSVEVAKWQLALIKGVLVDETI